MPDGTFVADLRSLPNTVLSSCITGYFGQIAFELGSGKICQLTKHKHSYFNLTTPNFSNYNSVQINTNANNWHRYTEYHVDHPRLGGFSLN
jgi:hypothetical protein